MHKVSNVDMVENGTTVIEHCASVLVSIKSEYRLDLYVYCLKVFCLAVTTFTKNRFAVLELLFNAA